MGFFEKLKNGLKKTKDSMMGRIESLLHSFSKIDEDLLRSLKKRLSSAISVLQLLKRYAISSDRKSSRRALKSLKKSRICLKR